MSVGQRALACASLENSFAPVGLAEEVGADLVEGAAAVDAGAGAAGAAAGADAGVGGAAGAAVV